MLNMVVSSRHTKRGSRGNSLSHPCSDTHIVSDEHELANFAGFSAFGAFGASSMCASVLPGFGSTIALTGNTLAIRQDPPYTACPIDLVLWHFASFIKRQTSYFELPAWGR